MANHLDFLSALDEHVRGSALGMVMSGGELHTIARDAGLVDPGEETAARWIGQLGELGFVKHGPLSFGDQRPMPRGGYWTPQEVFRVGTTPSRVPAMRRPRPFAAAGAMHSPMPHSGQSSRPWSEAG